MACIFNLPGTVALYSKFIRDKDAGISLVRGYLSLMKADSRSRSYTYWRSRHCQAEGTSFYIQAFQEPRRVPFSGRELQHHTTRSITEAPGVLSHDFIEYLLNQRFRTADNTGICPVVHPGRYRSVSYVLSYCRHA